MQRRKDVNVDLEKQRDPFNWMFLKVWYYDSAR